MKPQPQFEYVVLHDTFKALQEQLDEYAVDGYRVVKVDFYGEDTFRDSPSQFIAVMEREVNPYGEP